MRNCFEIRDFREWLVRDITWDSLESSLVEDPRVQSWINSNGDYSDQCCKEHWERTSNKGILTFSNSVPLYSERIEGFFNCARFGLWNFWEWKAMSELFWPKRWCLLLRLFTAHCDCCCTVTATQTSGDWVPEAADHNSKWICRSRRSWRER